MRRKARPIGRCGPACLSLSYDQRAAGVAGSRMGAGAARAWGCVKNEVLRMFFDELARLDRAPRSAIIEFHAHPR